MRETLHTRRRELPFGSACLTVSQKGLKPWRIKCVEKEKTARARAVIIEEQKGVFLTFSSLDIQNTKELVQVRISLHIEESILSLLERLRTMESPINCTVGGSTARSIARSNSAREFSAYLIFPRIFLRGARIAFGLFVRVSTA